MGVCLEEAGPIERARAPNKPPPAHIMHLHLVICLNPSSLITPIPSNRLRVQTWCKQTLWRGWEIGCRDAWTCSCSIHPTSRPPMARSPLAPPSRLHGREGGKGGESSTGCCPRSQASCRALATSSWCLWLPTSLRVSAHCPRMQAGRNRAQVLGP